MASRQGSFRKRSAKKVLSLTPEPAFREGTALDRLPAHDGESYSPQGPGARSPGPMGPGAASMMSPPPESKAENATPASNRSQRSPAAPGLGPMSPNLQEQLQLMGVASMKAQIRPKANYHSPPANSRSPVLADDGQHGSRPRRLHLVSGGGLAAEGLNQHLGITDTKAQNQQRRAALCRKAMRPYDMEEEQVVDDDDDEEEEDVSYQEDKHQRRADERRDSEVRAEENVRELEDALRTCISRLNRLEGGTNDRNRDEWRKQEAMLAGLTLVEEERKRGEDQCSVLLKRIQFLSEELDEARSQLDTQRENYAELLEAAKELAEDKDKVERSRSAPLFSFPGSKAQTAPTNGSNTSMGGGRVCEIALCSNPFAFLWGGR